MQNIDSDDYLVCTCMGVMYSDIVRAIMGGLSDFDALRDELMIGTGCTSCVDEILHILKSNALR